MNNDLQGGQRLIVYDSFGYDVLFQENQYIHRIPRLTRYIQCTRLVYSPMARQNYLTTFCALLRTYVSNVINLLVADTNQQQYLFVESSGGRQLEQHFLLSPVDNLKSTVECLNLVSTHCRRLSTWPVRIHR